jgi:hypothetical protein
MSDDMMQRAKSIETTLLVGLATEHNDSVWGRCVPNLRGDEVAWIAMWLASKGVGHMPLDPNMPWQHQV